MAAFWRTILVLLALIMAVAAPSYVMRETLLEWALKAALAYNGVKDIKLTVTMAELNGLEIENIRLGPKLGPNIGVKSFFVIFSPSELIKGQVQEINLAGLDLDLFVLNDLISGLLPSKPSSASFPAFPMPLINIHGAILHGAIQGVDFSVLLDGSMAPDWSGAMHGAAEIARGANDTLKSQWLNARIEWQAKMDEEGFASIEAAFLGDFYSPLIAPSSLSGKVDYTKKGGVAFKAGLTPSDGGWLGINGHHAPGKTEAALSSKSMTIGGINLAELDASLNAIRDEKGALSATARIVRARIEASGKEASVTNAELAAEISESGFKWAELKSLSLALDGVGIRDAAAKFGVIDSRNGEGMGIKISGGRALLDLSGKQLSLRGVEGEIALNPETMTVLASLNEGYLSHEAPEPLFNPAALSGKASIDGSVLDFQARASILRREDLGGDILIRGHHDLAGGQGQAEAVLAPLAFLPEGGASPGDLSAALKGLEKASGNVKASANVHWAGDSFEGIAELAVNDLSFALETAGIAGLNLALRLDGLNPPFMKEAAEISATRITGAIPLENPRLLFRLKEGGDTIHILHARAGLIGGLLSAGDANIALFAPANRLVLKLSGMDMERIMKILNIEGVSGTGVLNGEIPLEIRGDKILVLDGKIAAETPGELRVRSPQAKEALGGGGEQVDLLLRVLDDFRYQRLTVSMNNNQDGEASILLNVEGANPAVLDGFPFNINLNLSANLNKMLSLLLDAYRFSGQAIRSAIGDGKR